MSGEVGANMRATILAEEALVIVDGKPLIVNCDELRATDIHAVQWYDNFGEIEFKTYWLHSEKRWDRKPNEIIEDFSEFQIYVDRWKEVNREGKAEYTWTPRPAEK
jgi:hypothetical protein